MFSYNFKKEIIDSFLLISEIQFNGLPAPTYINTFGQEVTIFFENELSLNQQTKLTTVVQKHTGKTIDEIISNLYDSAILFGAALMKDFVEENIKLGITRLKLTNHVRKTLFEVKDAAETGSLYDAIKEISILNPVNFDSIILTPTRILAVRNKIESFLGIQLSTNWNDPSPF